MNILKVKRGATVLQTFYYSVTAGQLTILAVDHIKQDGCQVCYSPQRIITDIAPFKGFGIDEAGNVSFDATEQVVSISTLWYKYVLSPTGKILELGTGGSMRANTVDVKDFVSMLGGAITMYIFNGWIRKINGYNTYPVFNNQGVIAYTELQLEEIASATPDTAAYDFKKVDGTWINPPAPVIEVPIEEPVTNEPDPNTDGTAV